MRVKAPLDQASTAFEIDRRILGHSETQLWTLTFDGNKVDVSFENTDGFKTQLHGEVAE